MATLGVMGDETLPTPAQVAEVRASQGLGSLSLASLFSVSSFLPSLDPDSLCFPRLYMRHIGASIFNRIRDYQIQFGEEEG